MSSGNPALSLDEVFLTPRALEPPPIRRALFPFPPRPDRRAPHRDDRLGRPLQETDGQYAGAAREMLESQQWLTPDERRHPASAKTAPPLLDDRRFLEGVWPNDRGGPPPDRPRHASPPSPSLSSSATGSAVPWRGFLAGLIHLCCCGTFLFGRIVMPEPVFSAFVAGALYCAIRGYERRQGRRRLVHRFLDFRRRLPA